MTRRRYRPIISGQGWIELPENQGERIAAAVVSPQPESVVSAEGKVRVHRLPKHGTDSDRVNVSGKLSVTPAGIVSRKA